MTDIKVPRGLLENCANYMEGSASAEVRRWHRELRALLSAPVETPRLSDCLLSDRLKILAAYLSRLANGEKQDPGNEILEKLGLRKVVSYQDTTGMDEAMRSAESPATAVSDEPVLSKPASVGGSTFGVGVKERLVIEAAQRRYEYNQQPEVEAARIVKARAFVDKVRREAGIASADGEPAPALEVDERQGGERDALLLDCQQLITIYRDQLVEDDAEPEDVLIAEQVLADIAALSATQQDERT